MPPGNLFCEVFWACPTGRRPRGRPKTHWRDYIFFASPLRRAEGGKFSAFLLRLVLLDPEKWQKK